MSSNVSAPTAPDGDNGSPQGHCNRCHRVWTLKTRQGVCQWCSHLAICQSSPTKPRSIKSRSNGRRKQTPVHNNGYDQLEGEWLAYYNVASRFTDRVKPQDKEDILHTIIATLADVERNNGHKPFIEAVMYRIASRKGALYYPLFYTFLFTDMRRSEALALRWSDIDFLAYQLSVNRAIHQLHNRQIIFRKPKTDKGRRLIALTPSTVSVLKEHKESQIKTRESLGLAPLNDNDLVFCQYDGKPLLTTCFKILI